MIDERLQDFYMAMLSATYKDPTLSMASLLGRYTEENLPKPKTHCIPICYLAKCSAQIRQQDTYRKKSRIIISAQNKLLTNKIPTFDRDYFGSGNQPATITAGTDRDCCDKNCRLLTTPKRRKISIWE